MSHTGSSNSTTTSTPDSPRDDWSAVSDPNERRKIQNRIAQRKFREKARQQRELEERNSENQRHAGTAYTPPDPAELDTSSESGLPWGSISLKHIVETGRIKEQSSTQASIYAAVSRAGGSSRLGLHLIDQYARGSPAWAGWRSQVPIVMTHDQMLRQ